MNQTRKEWVLLSSLAAAIGVILMLAIAILAGHQGAQAPRRAIEMGLPSDRHENAETPGDSTLQGIDALSAGEHVRALNIGQSYLNPEIGLSSLTGMERARVGILVAQEMRGTLDEAEVKSQVELELRKLGITISEDARIEFTLSLEGFQTNKQDYVYTVQTRVKDGVYLERGPPKDTTATFVLTRTVIWSNTLLGYSPRSLESLSESLDDAVKRMLDGFANEFLQDNEHWKQDP